MSEKNTDFDKVINRRNTNCLKYDFAKRRGKPENVIPLWVADMDFMVPEKVVEALQKRVTHGIFGYSEVNGSAYFEAIRRWMKEKHEFEIEERWLVKTPGVVFALAMAVKAFTKEGDAVIIQQPVYYPFSEVICDNNRRIVDNTLLLDENGKYHMDFVDFEKKVKEHNVKLFLLCNPHNPVGRVWTKEELEKIGKICIENDVIVVSDEIHEDFVFRGKHQVFANMSEKLKDRTITCTSPSKTFNLAGLQTANILIANQELKHRFLQQIYACGYSQLNTLGLIACEAAYEYGEEWHSELLEYLKDNLEYLRNYLKKEIPQISIIEPEGTYLVWLDFRKLLLSPKEQDKFILEKAELWLDSGAVFGKAGEGFERINIACPRSTLTKAVQKLKTAINTLDEIGQ